MFSREILCIYVRKNKVPSRCIESSIWNWVRIRKIWHLYMIFTHYGNCMQSMCHVRPRSSRCISLCVCASVIFFLSLGINEVYSLGYTPMLSVYHKASFIITLVCLIPQSILLKQSAVRIKYPKLRAHSGNSETFPPQEINPLYDIHAFLLICTVVSPCQTLPPHTL